MFRVYPQGARVKRGKRERDARGRHESLVLTYRREIDRQIDR